MKRELISNGNPLEDVVGFSRAVKVGQYVSVGGTAPVGTDGKTVGIGDIEVQTRHCLEIIKKALEDAGSGMHHVIRTRIFLTNIGDWKKQRDRAVPEDAGYSEFLMPMAERPSRGGMLWRLRAWWLSSAD